MATNQPATEELDRAEVEYELLYLLRSIEPFQESLESATMLRLTVSQLRSDGTLNRFLLEALRLRAGGSLDTPVINAVLPSLGADWNFWRPEAAWSMNHRIDYLPPVLSPGCFTSTPKTRIISYFNEMANNYCGILEAETKLGPEHVANRRDFVNWEMRRRHLKEEADRRQKRAKREQRLLHLCEQQCIEEQRLMKEQQHLYQKDIKEQRLKEDEQLMVNKQLEDEFIDKLQLT